MASFHDLVSATRQRLAIWLNDNLPSLGIAAGVGVTAMAVGATFGQLAAEAQVVGWSVASATLSAELGKDFVVGLVGRIRDDELKEEDIARIIQAEFDKGLPLQDLQRLTDQVGTLPMMLDAILRLNNAQLLASLQADLAAYPQIISIETAHRVQQAISPQIESLARDVAHLDATSQQILRILTALAATPSLAPTAGVESPLMVFVSSLINELSAERQAARETITALGLTRPWVFESTPATTQPLEEAYLEKVRHCDFFVLIVDENVSHGVEREFDTALQSGRPILAFLKKDKENKDQHRSAATSALVGRIPTKWATFSDPTDLALKARLAVTDEIIRRVREGLIKLSEAQVQRLDETESMLSRALSNLPARQYSHLVGREGDITSILQKLRDPDPTAASVIAITGLGGIGKTALAYETVERALLEGIFEGLVWESAKSEEIEGIHIMPLGQPPTLSFEYLLGSIARQLGYDALLQLPPRELYNRVRHSLQTGSYLIVVDNLETIQAYDELARQLHGLLSPSQSRQPSRALLTSRERLTNLPYIYDHYIRGLSKPASMDFIRQEAQTRGALGILQAGHSLLDRIFRVTYGMPLAMKLIVSQFLLGIPLDTELDRIEGAKEEEVYRFIYMRLWFKLSIPAQKVLIAAAAFAASVARFMLQPVSKTSDKEFEAAIPELALMSLIESSDHATAEHRRYSIHPLTRWFINSPLRELWEQQKTETAH